MIETQEACENLKKQGIIKKIQGAKNSGARMVSLKYRVDTHTKRHLFDMGFNVDVHSTKIKTTIYW